MRRKIREIDVHAAAYLHVEEGQKQETIARTLGISQSLVSRLIRQAEAAGFIETRIRFAEEKLSREEMDRVKAKIHPRRLEELLARAAAGSSGAACPVLHVYPTSSNETALLSAWRHRIAEFSKDCVEDLLAVLTSAQVIGVSWGDMLAGAIRVMKELKLNAAVARKPIRVVPLLGEPLGASISEYSSSVLASNLAEVLNGETAPGSTLSLAPVPALIPIDMTVTEKDTIFNLIGRITAYQEIYGSRQSKTPAEGEPAPWIDKVDAVLTGISSQERPLGFNDDQLILAAGIKRERLTELVIGDLCGVLIPRPNLDADALGEVKRINERWTGIKLRHLKNCAAKAANGAPGVIVLAIGANKAPMVYEAVRRGLIQHLFIDQDLANRLEEICGGPKQDA